MKDELSMDMILGGLYGALVGDAAGATLEFFRGDITERDVKRAMYMPGGGSLDVVAGQITDDGELTIALLQGLVDSKRESRESRVSREPCFYILKRYIQWYKSNPIDCGMTISRSLKECISFENTESKLIENAYRNARRVNLHSKGNGALMRCTPIGIYGAIKGMSSVEIAGLARRDAMLTHPHITCQDCSACYAIAIAYLILNPKDNQGAINTVLEWAKNEACDEVLEYLYLAMTAKTNMPAIDCKFQIGFLKHGFVLAFYFLNQAPNYTYMESIRKTLLLGGDTDTNACIVGGLMGAYWGQERIPIEMLQPVLLCGDVNPDVDIDCVNRTAYYNRPDWLHPRNVSTLVRQLLGEGRE